MRTKQRVISTQPAFYTLVRFTPSPRSAVRSPRFLLTEFPHICPVFDQPFKPRSSPRLFRLKTCVFTHRPRTNKTYRTILAQKCASLRTPGSSFNLKTYDTAQTHVRLWPIPKEILLQTKKLQVQLNHTLAQKHAMWPKLSMYNSDQQKNTLAQKHVV